MSDPIKLYGKVTALVVDCDRAIRGSQIVVMGDTRPARTVDLDQGVVREGADPGLRIGLGVHVGGNDEVIFLTVKVCEELERLLIRARREIASSFPGEKAMTFSPSERPS